MCDPTLFAVSTPLSFTVRVTRDRWELIVTVKHPIMLGREANVQQALQSPDEIRRSRSDHNVYLFYRAERAGRWICAVAKQTDDAGFLITCYPTDAIKEGDGIWTR